MTGSFCNILLNMYSRTKCSIKCGNKRTDYFTYGRGVRQGCVLYPLILDLYLNEIPNPLKACNFNDPVILPNGLPLSCLFYADDVVLFSSSATGLQTSLNIFQQYCKNWKLFITFKKTKVMVFEKQCRKSTLEKYSFFIDDDHIEISQDYSYLGLSFCANGNFSNSKRTLIEVFLQQKVFLTSKNYQLILVTNFLTHCSNLYYCIPQKYGVRMTKWMLINGNRTL